MITKALLTGALLVSLSPAHAFAAKAPAKPGDFNGDGRQDFAVGLPQGSPPRLIGRGVVAIQYGGTKKKLLLTPDSPGVRKYDHGDRFGLGLASADFDRDGYADLAVNGSADEGITIVYGSRKGLSSRAAFLRTGGGYIQADKLKVADFNGNGKPDLFAAQEDTYWVFSDVGTGKATAKPVIIPAGPGGRVWGLNPAPGDFNGDGKDDLVLLTGSPESVTYLARGSTTGIGLPVKQPQAIKDGHQMAVGDVDKDGKDDLITSAYNAITKISYGTATGLKPPTGIGRVSGAVAAGDLNQDGYADLVLGNADWRSGRGKITILYGHRKGVQTFSKATKGILGTPQRADVFGAQLALLDVNGDHRLDLVVSAPGETKKKGRVYVLLNSKGRITAKGVQTYNAKSFKALGNGFGDILLKP
jgi:hypothetical protein